MEEIGGEGTRAGGSQQHAELLANDSLLCGGYDTEDGYRGWEWRGMRPYAAASASLSLYTTGVAIASVCSVVWVGGGVPGAEGFLAFLAALGLALACASAVALHYIPSCLPQGVDFVVPWCPWLPLVAIAINVYLLAALSPVTWVRFGVWCLVGCFIYFGYGINNSVLERAGRGEANAIETEAGAALATPAT